MPTTTASPSRRTLWLLAIWCAIAAGVLWLIWDILAPFAVCALLIYLLEPLVSLLASKRVFGWRVPREAAVALIFSVVGLGLWGLGAWGVPRLSAEAARMAKELPRQLDELRHIYIPNLETTLQTYSDKWRLGIDAHQAVQNGIADLLRIGQAGFQGITEKASGMLAGLFHTVMTSILVMICTAFLLRDAPTIKAKLWELIPPKVRPDAKALTTALSRDLNGAIRGQLLICLINGVLTTLGLLLLGIPYAVTIGLIAGICSLIPVFGTVISTIPAVIVALTQSWLIALQVVGIIMFIHLIEANYLNPKVMGHNVELHPVIVLTSLYIGEHFLGIAGLLLAVPIAAAARSIVRFIYGRFLAPAPVAVPETAREGLEVSAP